MIDLSCPIEYTDDDVLFGKGERIKNHPGNINFRQEAKKLLERYESFPDKNKKMVAYELVDSVTNQGNFYLHVGPGDMWYPVINDAPREKASQLFRDARLEKQKEAEG